MQALWVGWYMWPPRSLAGAFVLMLLGMLLSFLCSGATLLVQSGLKPNRPTLC